MVVVCPLDTVTEVFLDLTATEPEKTSRWTILVPSGWTSMITANSVPRTSAVALLGPVTLNDASPTRRLTLFQVLPALWLRLTEVVPSVFLSTAFTTTSVPLSRRVTDPSG